MYVNGLQRSRLLHRGRLLTRRSVIRGLSASLTIGYLTACDAISSTPRTTQGRLELLLQEPATIDPGLVIRSHEATVTEALFEPLIHAMSNGSLQPGAAKSWEMSADGRIYRFRLYSDRRWTTGEDVIAEDFTWAWKRNLSPEVGATLRDLFFPIAGAENFARIGKDPNQIGIMTTENHLITAQLTHKNPSFLSRTGTTPYMPLPRGEIEGMGAYWTKPGNIRGNGPYKLVQWDKGRGLSLHPNTHYTGPPTLFRDVVIRFPHSDTDITATFRAGRAHAAEMSPEAYVAAKATKDLAPLLRLYERTGSWFIVLNTRKPPWHSPRIRLALSLALDRKQLLATAFDEIALPSTRLVPSTVLSNTKQEAPNINAARELLANEGFGDPNRLPTLQLTYHQTDQGDRITEELARQWKTSLGLNVEPDARDWTAFRSFATNTSDFGAYQTSWHPTYRHPQAWYDEVWHSNVDRFGSGWKNTEFDNLLKIAAATTGADQYNAYVAADNILNTETPAIPIGYFASAFLIKPVVDSFAINPVSGAVDLKKVKIAVSN